MEHANVFSKGTSTYVHYDTVVITWNICTCTMCVLYLQCIKNVY